MKPTGGGREFVVEEQDPDVYNQTGADPPVWQPTPQDILNMFQQLETDQVLPLKWVCSGRRPPEKEPPEQPVDFMSDEEDDDDDKNEEKRAPEPSAFDFDDTASETSSKVKMTPRTPVSAKAKRPEKKVARMDHVLNSIKRQQKADREARKFQARNLGASPFRSSIPSRMVGSPRIAAATTSPNPNSQPSSPRIGAPTETPLSRFGVSGEVSASKPAVPGSPSMAANRAAGSPAAGEPGSTAASVSPAPVSEDKLCSTDNAQQRAGSTPVCTANTSSAIVGENEQVNSGDSKTELAQLQTDTADTVDTGKPT